MEETKLMETDGAEAGTPAPVATDKDDETITTGTTKARTEPVISTHQMGGLFRDSTICVAVDVSGSTYGDGLAAEKKAVRSICSLIPPKLLGNVTILPWNDHAHQPLPVGRLDDMDSAGGTDPNAILADPDCRFQLQKSSFWFLLTDGLIETSLVHQFARSLADYGLHGKGAVVAVFGDQLERPSQCNITVGLSVFAMSPHVAFLYTNVEFNKTYVIQTKGCFSALLPRGSQNPHFDYDTSWEELPQTSYENLMRVHVPTPTDIGANEILLNEGKSKLDLDAFLKDLPVSEEIVGNILDNEENLRTVTLTAKSRGVEAKLLDWLDKLDRTDGVLDHGPGSREAPQKRSQLFDKVAADLASESGEPALDTREGSKAKSVSAKVSNAPAKQKQDLHHGTMHRRLSKGFVRRISNMSVTIAADNFGPIIDGDECLTRSKAKENEPRPIQTGFTLPSNPKLAYRSSCTVCSSNSVLHLLLVAAPTVKTTPSFPQPGSMSRLAFPLTMGNYAETDIISRILACSSCIESFGPGFSTRDDETIVSTLPLVSYMANKAAWLQSVSVGTQNRFAHADAPLVFFSILYAKLERLLHAGLGMREDEDGNRGERDLALQRAIRWKLDMLISEIEVSEMPPPLPGADESISMGVGPLHEVIIRGFRDCLTVDHKPPTLLRYPMDGFIVANAALSDSRHKGLLSAEKRRTIVFLRFLYQLTEAYCRFENDVDAVTLNTAKALLLLVDNPRAARTLFRWDSLRKASGYFKTVEDLAAYLRTRFTQFEYKVSIAVRDLAETPLLPPTAVADFRRLGVLFANVESQAHHSIAVFVHHLLRWPDIDRGVSPEDRFERMRKIPEVKVALGDPEGQSARSVQNLIRTLPRLHVIPGQRE